MKAYLLPLGVLMLAACGDATDKAAPEEKASVAPAVPDAPAETSPAAPAATATEDYKPDPATNRPPRSKRASAAATRRSPPRSRGAGRSTRAIVPSARAPI